VSTARFDDVAAVRRGEGAVRLKMAAPLSAVAAGTHRLVFRNAHLRGQSVYLANALVPENPRVSLVSQQRDVDQRELAIEYALRAEPSASTSAWLLVGFTVTAALLVQLTRHLRARGTARRLQGGSPS
jgi:hypothetical protein